MRIFRTRIKKEIVTEFAAPKGKSRGVVVLCSGVPSSSGKNELLNFLAAKGFWVFYPRYRGTWESGGSFLKQSPTADIADVLASIQKPIKELWGGHTFSVPFQQVYVVGSSFGGPATITLSSHKVVLKAFALSPVVDWSRKCRTEPLSRLKRYLRKGYGEAFRFTDEDWKKIGQKGFYNAVGHTDSVDGSKLAIVQAKDDDAVRFEPVQRFARSVGCSFTLLNEGGHFGVSSLMQPSIYRLFESFIRSK